MRKDKRTKNTVVAFDAETGVTPAIVMAADCWVQCRTEDENFFLWLLVIASSRAK